MKIVLALVSIVALSLIVPTFMIAKSLIEDIKCKEEIEIIISEIFLVFVFILMQIMLWILILI